MTQRDDPFAARRRLNKTVLYLTGFTDRAFMFSVGACLTSLFPYMRKHTKHDLDMIA